MIIFFCSECEKKMGKADFNRCYDYLKKARFGDNSSDKTHDENQITRELKKINIKPDDCFMVDQLLFLEEQHKIFC